MTRLFRTILVPHDFSPEATRALKVAAELAAAHGGRLLVLHVLTSSHPAASITTPAEAIAWIPLLVPSPALVADTRRHLECLVDKALPKNRRPAVECRVAVGDPVQKIMDAARGATVIVMATLGHTGLAHLLIGSVAEKVVRHSPIPVMTIRPVAPEAGARKESGALMSSTSGSSSNPVRAEASLVPMGREECLALLGQHCVGRLSVVIDGQPRVFPLNYEADEEGVIVFRTAELTAATEAALARVAFEVDEIDAERREGRSVAVHGYGRSITGAVDPESVRLRQLPLHPWAPGRRDEWFKITPVEITGRRLLAAQSIG